MQVETGRRGADAMHTGMLAASTAFVGFSAAHLIDEFLWGAPQEFHLQVGTTLVLALLFVTFPFVVRTVQPVLEDLDRDQEDAAATLGAGAWTIFRRVTLPALSLSILSGALLSFSRAIGEFGAIVIVAGNIPMYSQTAAVYVLGEVRIPGALLNKTGLVTSALT